MTLRDTITAMYADYAARDLDNFMDIIDDDICFAWPADEANTPFAATCAGKDGFRAFLQTLDDMYVFERFEIADLLVDGDRAAVRIQITVTHKATGKQTSLELADFWKFRDGKAVELVEIFDTAAAASIG